MRGLIGARRIAVRFFLLTPARCTPRAVDAARAAAALVTGEAAQACVPYWAGRALGAALRPVTLAPTPPLELEGSL